MIIASIDNLERKGKLKNIVELIMRFLSEEEEEKAHQFITQLFHSTIQKCCLPNARRNIPRDREIKIRLRREVLIYVVAIVKAVCFQISVRVIWIYD